MQAVYSLSAFLFHSGLEASDTRTLKAAALSCALLLASVPLAGHIAGEVELPLEDSHRDLRLDQVVERFRQGLPAQDKHLAYALGRRLLALSERHQISPSIVLSLIETESSFRPAVVSHKGAVGLMQLLPDTAAEVARKYRIHGYTEASDLARPEVNLELGVAYLAYLRGRFGQSAHYLAAYNLGPTALRSRLRRGEYSLGVAEGYVKKIHARTHTFRQAQNAPLPGWRSTRVLAMD